MLKLELGSVSSGRDLKDPARCSPFSLINLGNVTGKFKRHSDIIKASILSQLYYSVFISYISFSRLQVA